MSRKGKGPFLKKIFQSILIRKFKKFENFCENSQSSQKKKKDSDLKLDRL